eukprot:m.10130 g.10130  ORF g.10130 m.10130 type:complete len:231 (+) comp4205_c0_seq1:105-797(+)
MSNDKVFTYFNLRGRGEPIRLALHASKTAFKEVQMDYKEMKQKSGTEEVPFGQLPVYTDEHGTLCQMDAILRHVGRIGGLYGESSFTTADLGKIDMVLGGVEDCRKAYTNLIYQDKLSDEAKAKYKKGHLDTESMTERTGGAHFQYLENMLARSTSIGSSGFFVSEKLSIADIQLFDLVDLHLRPALFPEDMKAFPKLMALHAKISGHPGVAEYLGSEARPIKINGNEFG